MSLAKFWKRQLVLRRTYSVPIVLHMKKLTSEQEAEVSKILNEIKSAEPVTLKMLLHAPIYRPKKNIVFINITDVKVV